MTTPIVRWFGAALIGLVGATGIAAQDNGPDARSDDVSAPRLRAFGPGNVFQFRNRADGPRLGIMAEETADGVRVQEILADGLAQRAGLQVDDLVLRIGERHIARIDDIRDALRGAAPESDVTIAVVRQGEGVIELTGSMPEPQAGTDGHRGGVLGVTLDEQDGRVTVTQVMDESGAWFAGVEPGDVLATIDGEAIAGPDDVVGKVSSHAPGTFIDLSVERDGQAVALRARLGARRGTDRLLGYFGMPGASSSGLRNRLLGPRFHGAPLPSGPQAFRWNFHGDDGDAGLPDLENLHEWLGQLHLDGAHDLRIRIEDGVMTIERDGEVETYELDADRPFHAPPRVRAEDDAKAPAHDVGFQAVDKREA